MKVLCCAVTALIAAASAKASKNEAPAHGEDVHPAMATAIESDADDGSGIGDVTIDTVNNLRGRGAVLSSNDEDAAIVSVGSTNVMARDNFLLTEESLDVFEEEGVGTDYKYRVKFFTNDVGGASTSSKIDIYIVHNEDYENHNVYQDQQTYENGITYPDSGFWKPEPTWVSNYWYCNSKKFHDGTKFGIIICSDGSDGLYMDKVKIRKNCATGCQTAWTWNGDSCLATDAGQDFGNRCDQAYRCIHYKMEANAVRGVTRPSLFHATGACSSGIGCQETLGGSCSIFNPCCSGMKCNGNSKCYEERSAGEICGNNLNCENGLSCGLDKICYHTPRILDEPCSAFIQCGEGYMCGANLKCKYEESHEGEACSALKACVQYNPEGAPLFCDDMVCTSRNPCADSDQNERMIELNHNRKQLEDELQEAETDLEQALAFVTAKSSGLTSIGITEELHAYYSSTVTYCVNETIDMSEVNEDICSTVNDPNTADVNEYCNSTTEFESDFEGEICNENVTQAEVDIYNLNSLIDQLEKDLFDIHLAIDILLREIEDSDTNWGGFIGDCVHHAGSGGWLSDFDLSALVEFIDNNKCLIIKASLFVMGKIIDQLIKLFMGGGALLESLEPYCGRILDIKTWSLQVPGFLFTGMYVIKLVEAVVCAIADQIVAFEEVCSATALIENIAASLISGLCGNFGTAFIKILEPFVICNAWNCGDSYDIECTCPFDFSECSNPEMDHFALGEENDFLAIGL